jgi:hypothetical protein
MARAVAKRTSAGKKAAASTSPRKASAKRRSAAVKSAAKKKAASSEAVTKKRAVKPAAANSRKASAPKSAARKAATAKKPVSPPKVAPKKAKAASGRSAATKRPAAKVAASRRPSPKPATRRMRSATTRKVSASTAQTTAPRAVQSFVVSHLLEADFKADGLRPYAQYRDLGVALATGGLCQAHVIRFTPPCTDEVRKRHNHEVDLQLVYVLKGWVKNEFEEHGVQMMSQGSCWIQPPGIAHTVLDYSADCELLEIVVPADFTTTEL